MPAPTTTVTPADAFLPCLCPKCGRRSALKAVALDPAAIIHPERPRPWQCKCGHCGRAFHGQAVRAGDKTKVAP